MSKKLLLLFILISLFTLASCQIREASDIPLSSDMIETEAKTHPETEPVTDVPETEAVTETEIITEEATTAPETYVEYVVEDGNVWIGTGYDEPEPDETKIVIYYDTVPEFYAPAMPETEVYEPIETEPVIIEPVPPEDRPVRDDIDTSQPYAPTVFMYHSVKEDPTTSLENLFLRPSEFESQLQTMTDMGCTFLFADEYAYTAEKSVMLQFDDGYEDNYTEMFPILKKYNAKATIFIITGYVNSPGYLTVDQIKEMADSGLVRFCSHTFSHPNLTSLSENELRYQFEISKQYLTSITGVEGNAICYPGGFVNDFVVSIAEEYYSYGYTTVNSGSTYGCDPMQLPRVRISRGMGGSSIAQYLY